MPGTTETEVWATGVVERRGLAVTLFARSARSEWRQRVGWCALFMGRRLSSGQAIVIEAGLARDRLRSQQKKARIVRACDQSAVRSYSWSAPPPPGWALSLPSSWGDGMLAVSGFSRPLWSGPRPSLMRARESGVILVCQPLSAWYLVRASFVDWSHVPVGSPLR